jgi:nicotinamide riboside transporter PnuC
MSNSEWLLSVIITVSFFSFYFWFKSYSKHKIAQANKTEEVERNKARIAVFLFPIVGLMFIVSVLFNMHAIPSGNEPFAIAFILLGFGFILFGLYKWYQVRQ